MTDLERRIGLVRERCSLTAFGAFALELLLLAEWDPDLNGTNGIYPDELIRAWEKNRPNAEAGGKTDRAELDKEIRTIAGRNVEEASGRIIYRIREQVLRFIEQEFPPDPDEFFLEIFSNFEKAEEPDPERSVYRDMIRVEQKKKVHSDGWILLNLAGKDGSGRLENVKAFCREKKMGLILLDGSSLLELGREKFRSMFGELGVNSLLKERVIAVTWEDALGER